MSYNNNGGTNPYLQYLRNVPGPSSQRGLRVGEPITTPYGMGIITDIRRANGGLQSSDYANSPAILISVILQGEKVPRQFPLNTIAFQSTFSGAVAWNQETT